MNLLDQITTNVTIKTFLNVSQNITLIWELLRVPLQFEYCSVEQQMLDTQSLTGEFDVVSGA